MYCTSSSLGIISRNLSRLYDCSSSMRSAGIYKEAMEVLKTFETETKKQELLEEYRRVNSNYDYIRKFTPSDITNVEFYPPAVKMTFKDGTVMTAVAQEGDEYNPEIGMMVCIMKYIWGGAGFNTCLHHWVERWDKKQEEKAAAKKAQEEAIKKEKEEKRKAREQEQKQKEYEREQQIEIQKEAYLRAMREYVENVLEANAGVTE